MNKTKSTSKTDVVREWHFVDMKNVTLGRGVTKISQFLMGKHKPYFVRHLDCGDYVVVVNADKIVVTGKKLTDKVYTSYSGYPGGIRKETLRELLSRRPEEVIRRAVMGMLPKNKLRDQWMKKLYVYEGEEHPYGEKFKSQNSNVKKK